MAVVASSLPSGALARRIALAVLVLEPLFAVAAHGLQDRGHLEAQSAFAGVAAATLVLVVAATAVFATRLAPAEAERADAVTENRRAAERLRDLYDRAPTGYCSIDRDGIVTGTFTNQKTRVFGQVALATFPNNEGLVALSDNTYTFGPNSGEARIVTPQTAGAGSIRSGFLEQANVEIAREFVNLITASTGIASASRVVRVADDLLQELLLLAR